MHSLWDDSSRRGSWIFNRGASRPGRSSSLSSQATRTGEVVGARPEEIKDQVWTIPAERMKGKKEHRGSLSERAVEIIQEMKPEHSSERYGVLRSWPNPGS